MVAYSNRPMDSNMADCMQSITDLIPDLLPLVPALLGSEESKESFLTWYTFGSYVN